MAVRSYLDVAFYRDRVGQCLELAEASRSVPPIKSRLEALAQKYLQRLDELERASPPSPRLAPDDRKDSYVDLTSDGVSSDALHSTVKAARAPHENVISSRDELVFHLSSICAALNKEADLQTA